MNIDKLENRLEKLESRRKQLMRQSDPYSGDAEDDSELDIIHQAELNGIDEQIKHIERKIN